MTATAAGAGPDPGFAAQIARFAATLNARRLDGPVVDALTTRIVDTLGCMRGGAASEPVQRALAAHHAFGGRADGSIPAATVIGTRATAPVEAAALINGIAARYLDFNDIYLSREAIHPSDNLAVALALAEALGCGGRTLLTAVMRGYEVHCRLADALSTRRGGWDNVVMGAIAASVMAGSLLRLGVDAQAQAINIAATGNVALMQTRVGVLSMWKAIAAAYAGRAGLIAALLAQQGITGPDHALDGKHGLFAQVTGAPVGDAFASAGDGLRLLDTHLKAYPSQYFTQTAVDAALALRGEVSLDAIRRIVVSTFEFGRVASADTPDKWQPSTRETADHSMPYCVAVALLDGALGARQFDDERIGRADVRSLMPRIEVIEDDELTRRYPAEVPTRIRIELAGGGVAETTVTYPTGHSRKPMRRDQVEAKYLDLVHDSRAREHLDRLWRLEALSPGDTGALLRAVLA